jgi:hypothetical protein
MSFDIANFNLLNWANATPDLYDSTPKDVQIQLKDSNGNITTKTVANRGKFKQQLWDDVGGALGQFDRTFYVDAVNGDDNNDGSSGHPFKTIKKAVDSVPIGGLGKIYLTEGQIFNIPSTINVDFKKIYIYGAQYWNKVIDADDKLNSGVAIIEIDPINEQRQYFTGFLGHVFFSALHIRQKSVATNIKYSLSCVRMTRVRGSVWETVKDATFFYTYHYGPGAFFQEEYFYKYSHDIDSGDVSHVVSTGATPYIKTTISSVVLQGTFDYATSIN